MPGEALPMDVAELQACRDRQAPCRRVGHTECDACRLLATIAQRDAALEKANTAMRSVREWIMSAQASMGSRNLHDKLSEARRIIDSAIATPRAPSPSPREGAAG
jgi:hypothetical protein